MSAVLLSASFPSGERGEAVAPYYPSDIGAAAAAVAEGVLRTAARLVFGGHPTISPMVLQIAAALGAGDRVVIYQSDHFAGQMTEEVHRLVEAEGADLRPTPAGRDREESLAIMRRAMLGEELRAAFYVGGMEGTRKEFDLLHRIHPSTVRYLLVAPGGMTARLVESPAGVVAAMGVGEAHLVPPRPVALLGRAYASLVLQALRAIDLDPTSA